MISGLMGITLYNYSIASQAQEVPNRIDLLETRAIALETTVAGLEKNSSIINLGACVAYNSLYVSMKKLTIKYSISTRNKKSTSGLLPKILFLAFHFRFKLWMPCH